MKKSHAIINLVILCFGIYAGWVLGDKYLSKADAKVTPRVKVVEFTTPEGKKLKITRDPGKLSRPTFECKNGRIPIYKEGKLYVLIEADRMYRGKTGPLKFDNPTLTRFDINGNVLNSASAKEGWMELNKGAEGFTVDAMQFQGKVKMRVYQVQKQLEQMKEKKNED